MADNPFENLATKTKQISQQKKNPFDGVAVRASEENLGPLAFANRAIAGLFGAPADVIAGGLSLIPGVDIPDPVGGRKSIERLFSFIGAPSPPEGREPKTLPEFAGVGVGEVAALAFPMGRVAKGVAKGANLVGRISNTLFKSMVKHPAITIVSEIGGGAGAGLGRGIAETEFPERPALKGTSEIVGGVVGGLIPTALINTPSAVAFRTGKRVFQRLTLPFTEKGGMFRAGEFVKGKVPSPEKTLTAITEETISDLPPAVQSGERRLVELFKSLTTLDPVKEAETIETLSREVIKLEGEMRRMGFGSSQLLTDITRNRVAAIELGIDKRVTEAMARAQRKLGTLPVATRKAQEARIVRNELELVMRKELQEAKRLWKLVPKDTEVGFEATRAKFQRLKDDLAFSQRNDIPVFLKKDPIIVGKKKPKVKRPAGFVGTFREPTPIPETTTLKEMQGLRSKLLESARIARDKKQWNKARIASDMADAVLEDIGIVVGNATTPESAKLQAALSYTRKNKERFEQGIVGKLLGFSREGAPSIDPDLTLEVSIGRLSERGAIDLSKVVVTPEARKATERYLTRSFVDSNAFNKKTGEINPVEAGKWIRNNEAILDQFPELRTQLTDASTAQDLATKTQTIMAARKKALQNPKISQAARILEVDSLRPEIKSIFNSDNPARMARASELIRKAKKNPTALGGVKADVIDFMLEKSSIGQFNEIGEKTLSGRTLLNFIKRNSATLKQFFSPKELSRMNRIGSELAKVELFEKAKAGKPEVELKDAASSALRLFSRISGARIGGFLGRESAGGSLQMAQIFSGKFKDLAIRLTRDKSLQIIHDAILSKKSELLKALLAPLDKPESKSFLKNLVTLNKQMNLWLAGTGKRVAKDIEDEIREDKE